MDAKTLCLAVLSQGDASGYEIRKAVESGPFGYIQDIGYSSIYPALSRLYDDNLVTVTEYAQEGRPDKKVYKLTPEGRMALLGALQEPTESDRTRSDFLFRMLFADILPPAVVEQMIDSRLQEIEGAIWPAPMPAPLQGLESAGEAFLNGFAASGANVPWPTTSRKTATSSSAPLLIPQRAVAE